VDKGFLPFQQLLFAFPPAAPDLVRIRRNKEGLMKLFQLKALGIVALLFMGVYAPAFVAIGLLKPRTQTAIPIVIGMSLAIAIVFIYFMPGDSNSFSQFGFKLSSYRYIGAAVALGVPVGLALTFVVSRFNSTNSFGEVSLSPWMMVCYFIVGTPIQEEVIFRGLLQTTLEQRLVELSVFGHIALICRAYSCSSVRADSFTHRCVDCGCGIRSRIIGRGAKTQKF
jgi:membrane protease YdiL (CAAX protease family)